MWFQRVSSRSTTGRRQPHGALQQRVGGRQAGHRDSSLHGNLPILLRPRSRLAFRILRGAMASAPHWIYDAAGSWVDPNGLARIELPPNMDIMDAYTVARFVLDPVGLKRATAIITPTADRQRGTLPIDVLPPFNGHWRVRATGKWLSDGQSRAFLVFALVRCEATVPFKELSVRRYGLWGLAISCRAQGTLGEYGRSTTRSCPDDVDHRAIHRVGFTGMASSTSHSRYGQAIPRGQASLCFFAQTIKGNTSFIESGKNRSQDRSARRRQQYVTG